MPTRPSAQGGRLGFQWGWQVTRLSQLKLAFIYANKMRTSVPMVYGVTFKSSKDCTHIYNRVSIEKLTSPAWRTPIKQRSWWSSLFQAIAFLCFASLSGALYHNMLFVEHALLSFEVVTQAPIFKTTKYDVRVVWQLLRARHLLG